jgi:hypothetical protein
VLEPVRQKWNPVLAKDRRKKRNESLSDASICVGQALVRSRNVSNVLTQDPSEKVKLLFIKGILKN